jgi:hypothetical protein
MLTFDEITKRSFKSKKNAIVVALESPQTFKTTIYKYRGMGEKAIRDYCEWLGVKEETKFRRTHESHLPDTGGDGGCGSCPEIPDN